MTLDQIMERVAAYRCRLVEITGGEPLLQNETPRFIFRLLENGFDVMMETNGSLDISKVDDRCIKIVDVKCPSSGESGNNDLENLHRLTPGDQIKFVIGDRTDYAYAKEIIAAMTVSSSMPAVLMSPVSGKMHPAELAKWILDDHLHVRLNIQLHKIIWPDADRGV
jgi:7-carboxy-7-deazaguanine synthase